MYYNYLLFVKNHNLKNTLIGKDLISIIIFLAILFAAAFLIKNERIKKSIHSASISTIIAFFAYHDLVFTTFYFVFLLTYFYGEEIVE